MIGEIIQTTSGAYVRCAPGSKLITREQDALDLLAYCHEAKSNKIMLDEACLHPDFFDLSTGLAGAIFLKFSTYRVQTAIVADLKAIKSERFQELIYECNKGKQINFFDDALKAEKWLTTTGKG